MKKNMANLLKTSVLTLSLTCMTSAFSGVILNGTRVIFNNGENEKSIYLTNKDNYPNLIQIWFDKGDENSSIESAEKLFLISPQIFKINPNMGQTVRLFKLNDDALPKDRESLYYMNFSEIPAIKKDSFDSNRLMVVFKNRVKVFYRPKLLSGSKLDVKLDLKFKLNGMNLSVINSSAYYINVKEMVLMGGDHEKILTTNDLISPKSNKIISLKGDDKIIEKSKLRLTVINDYGSLVTYDFNIN